MPLYEFECQDCRQISEKLMKISDPAPDTCVYCGKGPLVKIVSRSNFVLKGQGWYETDFKTKPKTASTSTSTEPTSTPKSDNKPTAPSEKAETTAAPVAAANPSDTNQS